MTDYKTLIVEKEGAVDWLTLNRPDALNAMNPELVDELQDYFGKLYTDHSVRIVVIKGAGRAFCAGLDLKDRSNRDDSGASGSPQAGLVSQRRISEIVMRMRRCPQAIISLVHGPACGGGFALALASDIRIAGKSARMNAAFIRIGLSACDIGVSYFLPRLVGVTIASELMMTGRFINADRAERVGLVSEVVEDDRLEEAAKPYIEEMLTTSPLGLRLTKECLNMSVDAGSLEAAVAMEDRNQILCAQTQDFREGISAFLEKRRPEYTNS
ncbi:enoyl-CoA hydratase/isomerase family protein [Parvibaculum sp.]|uniref:enoyl-CoA hydratase/isomerase family protein n=1 Tax=Parvibaculum sp. TaxID=2024848 RepID=UPI001B158608|nr:enoyl-CoA hydratase/isomerase family protein [Parvibaculum sp.]MBO6633751.1 enoyl-CoA hydratase/isomerase family protein [Parvibaculum sp.]MBO6677019.1 enoyl-CoA hydratase/isomerase family protein [Parvibaculum sp.]MBO6683457.1 enoyl-CoA hydratase/isomerase family protein [Parvibaculum sp.]MBO6904834.1 enoyl-CoA hydratase/isomerase family protein [Parvibaculum sp.]